LLNWQSEDITTDPQPRETTSSYPETPQWLATPTTYWRNSAS
jgi:hypothetical protein